MALDVAVLVDDVAILVNSKANKTLGVALDDLADDIAILILNLAILDNAQTLKTGEGTLRASDTLVLRDDLALADDLAGVAVDETVLITAAASKLLDVALDKTAEGNALLVDDVALLVEHLVLKDAVVHFFFLLFLFLPGVGVTLDVAVLVDNVAVLIDSETNQALGVALDDLTNDVLVLVGDLATLDDTKAFEAGEGTLRFGLALLLGNELDAANDLTLVVPELALVVELPAGNLLGLALDQAGDGSSLLADDDTSLVDLLALQEGQVDRLLLLLGLLFLLVAVGVTDDRALLVDDVSVFVNRATEKLLGVTLSDNTNNVAVLVSDVAVLDDLEALEASEGSFLLVLFLGNSLGAADDLALVVPELSLGVGGDAGLGELLGVALNKLTNNVAIAVEKLASLVARKAVKDGERGKGIALLFFFLVLALTFLLLFAFLGLLALNLAFTFLAFRGLFLLFLGLLRKSADRTKDGLAILVEDLALVVDLLAGALGKLAVSKLTNLLAIFVQDLALLVELVALKGLNARSVVLLGQLTELLKKLLGGGLSSLTLSDANLADNIALLVDDLALLVDLLAGALGRVALGELTNLLTIVIKDLALLVDLAVLKNADVVGGSKLAELLSSTLGELSIAQDVAVLVNNLTLLVDVEGVGVNLAINDLLADLLVLDLAKDTTVRANDLASLVKLFALKGLDAGKLVFDALGLLLSVISSILSSILSILGGVGGVLGVILGAVDSVASFVNLSVGSGILNGIGGSAGGLVDTLLNKVGSVFVDVGVANNVTLVIDEFTVGVESGVLELRRVALGDLTDGVALGVVDETVDLAGQTLHNGEAGEVVVILLVLLIIVLLLVIIGVGEVLLRTLGKLLAVLAGLLDLSLDLIGEKLAAADKVTIVVKDLSVVANGVTLEVLGVTLRKLADGVALGVVDVAIFANLEALEHAEVAKGSTIGNTVGLVLDTVDLVLGTFSSVVDLAFGVFGGVLDVALSIFGLVLGVLSLVLDTLSSVFGLVLSILSGVLSLVLDALGGIFGLVFGTLSGLTSLVGGLASDLLALFGSALGSLLGTILDVLGSLLGVLSGLLRILVASKTGSLVSKTLGTAEHLAALLLVFLLFVVVLGVVLGVVCGLASLASLLGGVVSYVLALFLGVVGSTLSLLGCAFDSVVVVVVVVVIDGLGSGLLETLLALVAGLRDLAHEALALFFVVVVVLVVLDLDVLLGLLARVLGGVLGLAGLLASIRCLGLGSRFGRLSTLGCGLAELLGSVSRLPAELGGSLGGAGLLPACRWGGSHVI